MQATELASISSAGGDVLDDMHVDVRVGPRWKWRQFASFVGSSGLVIVAYLDPGNLESDLQIGALSTSGDPTYSFRFLWILLCATACGWVLQSAAVHVGVFSGLDICSLTRLRYPRFVSVCLWVLSELAILSADIQALIGAGLGLHVLSGLSVGASTFLAFILSFAIFFTKFGLKPLEVTFFVLLLATASVFVWAALESNPTWSLVLKGCVVPVLPHEHLFQAVGLVGSLLMPHTVLVQSALVNSRHYEADCPYERERQHQVVSAYANAENAFGLFASFLVNASVVLAFAAAASKHSAEQTDWSLSNAGSALESVLGPSALYVWGAGLLASGMNASIAGCFSGQIIINGFLDLQISASKRYLVSRLITIVPVGLAVALLSRSQLDEFLSGANALQALLLPYILLLLMKMLLEEPRLAQHRVSGGLIAFLKCVVIVVILGNGVMIWNQRQRNALVRLCTLVLYGLSLFFVRYHQLGARRFSASGSSLLHKLLP